MTAQTCTFCQNPDSILSLETCCTGCSRLKDSPDPQIQELKKIAMNSEHGGVWYSPHGPIFISKEGDFRPLDWKMPKYPENPDSSPDKESHLS